MRSRDQFLMLIPARDLVHSLPHSPGLGGEPLPVIAKVGEVCGFQPNTFRKKIYAFLKSSQNRPVVRVNTHELLLKP